MRGCDENDGRDIVIVIHTAVVFLAEGKGGCLG